MTQNVAEVYDQRPTFQWTRLDAFPCELYIHLTALLDELPPGSRVLDVGAGPARFAIELARAGHRVTVGDISQVMLKMARERVEESGVEGIGEIVELDACDLSRFPDQSFDAVVAFGPFYHLTDSAARLRAVSEMARVVRPGGRVFATFKPRTFWLSMALHTLVTGADTDHPNQPKHHEHLEHLEDFLATGRLEKVKSPQLKRSWFCRVEEIEPLFASQGFVRRSLMASSGVTAVWSRPGTWKAWRDRDPELRSRLLELVRRTAEDPHVLGMSDQVLFIGERDDRPTRRPEP